MKLIYRGQIIDHQVKSAPSTPKPQATNWRYQIPPFNYEPTFTTAESYSVTKAVNWRFSYEMENELSIMI